PACAQPRAHRQQRSGQGQEASAQFERRAGGHAPAPAAAFDQHLVEVQQLRRVLQVQREQRHHQQDFGLQHVHSPAGSLPPPKNLRIATPTPTTPTSSSFQNLAMATPIAANQPFFDATAAAPPVISAASPISATWSPGRNSP